MIEMYGGPVRTLILLILIVLGLPGQYIFSEELEQDENCSKDLILSYFPENIVNTVLMSYRVPQNSWASINEELHDQDEMILSKVEAKTSQMNPNPLNDPALKAVAVNIFRETLYETFGDVMNKYGIDDEDQIQAMMDEIQYKKAEHFKKCIDKRKARSHFNNSENIQ